MTPSIPASQLVNVIPSVLGAGGNPLSLNAVFLTSDPSIPIGTVQAFQTLASVQAWFGANSPEAILAANYFSGFIGATTLPGTLYFAQYNTVAVAGYLRSGSFAGVPLSYLTGQAPGTIVLPVDDFLLTSASIDLSGATSFSDAASIVQTGLQGGYSAQFTAVQAGAQTHMIVTGITGTLHVNDVLSGAGVDSGLTIVSQVSGTTGGNGTYVVSTTTGFSSTTVTATDPDIATVTASYDAVHAAFVITSPTTGATSFVGFTTAGTIGAALKLASAAGAVESPGADIAVPATLMANVSAQNQNWATFMTVDEVIDSVKLAFAAWVNSTNDRYAYIVQDSNAAVLTGPAGSSFGVLTESYDGVCPVYDTTGSIAAFICGAAASIDFDATQGRITFAYKSQAGLTPDVTDADSAANAIGNGYNFYGAYATANQSFQFLQPGLVSGSWNWLDEYINQIWLNNALQLALVELLANTKSIPYNQQGYALIRASCLDPINAALNAGVIQAGVNLSASQVQELNTAAGVDASTPVQQLGWYLQIKPASSGTRVVRGSPPMTLWYTDGGSVQKINLASIDVQ